MQSITVTRQQEQTLDNKGRRVAPTNIETKGSEQTAD